MIHLPYLNLGRRSQRGILALFNMASAVVAFAELGISFNTSFSTCFHHGELRF